MAQPVKNPSAMQERLVRSLDWEDPLEEEMVTHSCILAQEISWTEEPGGLQSTGAQKRHNFAATAPPGKLCLSSQPRETVNS